jgi:transcriptional regulator with XRE-family HTH domain
VVLVVCGTFLLLVITFFLLKIIICNKIKQLRKKHGYSQEEVAEMLNMGQNTYSQLESGKTKLDIERLHQIACLYKVSLNELLSELPTPHNLIHQPRTE